VYYHRSRGAHAIAGTTIGFVYGLLSVVGRCPLWCWVVVAGLLLGYLWA